MVSCTRGRSSTLGLNVSGRDLGARDEGVAAHRLVADEEALPGRPDRAAAALEVEERRRRLLRRHLHVVAARHQVRAGRGRQARRLARVLEFVA